MAIKFHLFIVQDLQVILRKAEVRIAHEFGPKSPLGNADADGKDCRVLFLIGRLG